MCTASGISSDAELNVKLRGGDADATKTRFTRQTVAFAHYQPLQR